MTRIGNYDYVTLEQVQVAREVLRRGMDLGYAARRADCSRSALDQALWRNLGVPTRPLAMFK